MTQVTQGCVLMAGTCRVGTGHIEKNATACTFFPHDCLGLLCLVTFLLAAFHKNLRGNSHILSVAKWLTVLLAHPCNPPSCVGVRHHTSARPIHARPCTNRAV